MPRLRFQIVASTRLPHRPALTPSPWSRRAALLVGLACVVVPVRSAEPLPVPNGTVVLVVSGQVQAANAGDRAEFDMEMLARLPQHSFSTQTPWYGAARKFTGPLLRDVLAAVGARGTQLRVTALNDYHVDLPVEDTLKHDVLLARLLDDRPMAVRDKGPLFIIYPFDSSAALRNAVYYSRSAWQVKTIEVQ